MKREGTEKLKCRHERIIQTSLPDHNEHDKIDP